MTHYFTQNAKELFEEETKDLTQTDWEDLREMGEMMFNSLMDGKMYKATVQNAIREEDIYLADDPATVTLFDPEGLKTKIIDDVLYVGTNGDWLNFSLALDLLNIDWKAHLDVED